MTTTTEALRFRPARLEDAAFAADMATALHPDEPEDRDSWQHWWQSADPAWTMERFIAESGGAPVGYVNHQHAPWKDMPKRYGRVGADFMPAHRSDANLTAGYDLVEERSRTTGTKIFSNYVREDDERILRFLEARGYREERRTKGWELDLVARRAALETMAAQSRAKMRESGITIQTIDEDTDPDKFHKIHEMSEEAASDVPTTVPHVREPFEQFMKWFDSPSVRLDRMWIAREGNAIVGISVLAYPRTRGNVWTDWTGTARTVRGRGVARALKLETVMQAIALGTTSVRTENDGANAPILHLNEEMGYVRIPGFVQLLKDA
ncbi:MAG: GNAT family N-acetyltransferase [Chloroflexota bacterium]|nr:GNAT family N-acetyltransferase [Chloroflexota bacterium]